MNQARRAGGEVETSKKYGAGGNKQSGAAKNTATLDQVCLYNKKISEHRNEYCLKNQNPAQETEELKHDHVSRNFALALQKARNDKGFTQKDFATRVRNRQGA